MIYFSELEGKKVFTEDKIELGILDDVIFLASDHPQITKFVVKTPTKERIIIPIQSVVKVNSIVQVKKSYLIGELADNELYIRRNLLDKQIIDIVGSKIVRVNDVTFQEKLDVNSHEIYLTGVDIGILGLFRRMRMESLLQKIDSLFGFKLTSEFLSWGDIQPLELTRGKVQLKKEETKLQNMRPEDLADYLEKTNEVNVRKFLRILDKKFAAVVISRLNIGYQRDLFRHWTAEKAASILEMIESEESVDILLTLPKKKRDDIITLLSQEKKDEVIRLLGYAKTPIGKKISAEYLTVLPTTTAYEAIQKIKKEATDFSFLAAIYVLNTKNQLVGVFNLHDLLRQNNETPVYKFMIQNLIEIMLSTPIEIAISKMLRYHLPALPVVDKEKHMLGVITFDHVADQIKKKLQS